MKSTLKILASSCVLLLLLTAGAHAQKANQRKFTPAEIAISPFGQSKEVVRDFKDDGSINRHNQWWGLQLISFTITYDDNKKSDSIVVSSHNTIKEVRAAANTICGFTDADWVRQDDPDGKVLLDAKNKYCKAGIDNFTNGNGVVTLGIMRQ